MARLARADTPTCRPETADAPIGREALCTNPLRKLLSTLGVIIGVASIVATEPDRRDQARVPRPTVSAVAAGAVARF